MDTNSTLVEKGTNIFIWLMVGFVVLWVISYMAERISRMFMPSMPFIIVTVVVGAIAVGGLTKVFG